MVGDMQPRDYTAELRILINSKNFNNKDAMKLIQKGANPNIQNDEGNTFIHILVKVLMHSKDSKINKFLVVIEKLVKNYGAKINIKNSEGLTPLQCLMKDSFHLVSAKKLIDLGASADLDIHCYINPTQLTMEKHIGRGAFGEVYSGKWKKEDTTEKTKNKTKVKKPKETTHAIVIKEMIFIDVDCKEQYASYCNEVSILQALTEVNAPNVIAYFGFNMQRVSEYRTAYRIVMEDGKYSLVDIINDSNNSLDWGTRLEIIKGMINGFEFIHGLDILHRDIKSANILIDGEMKTKIADFGIACEESECAGIAGTPLYMPPELLNGSCKKNSKTTDVYSLGYPINEVISGELFEIKEPKYLVKKPDACSLQMFTLFQNCWEKEPKVRPTMKQLKVATTIDSDQSATSRITKL
jgi:tRNA A-37 threonylcarbamoyl transferase component Bud32